MAITYPHLGEKEKKRRGIGQPPSAGLLRRDSRPASANTSLPPVTPSGAVDIYAAGTPTARAQDRQIPAIKEVMGGALTGTRNIAGAVISPLQKFSRDNLGGKYTGGVLGAISDRVSADAADTRRAADTLVSQKIGDSRAGLTNPATPNFSAGQTDASTTSLNKRYRDGLGKRFPAGRVVVDQRPVTQTLSQDRAIPGMGPLMARPQSRVSPQASAPAAQQIGGNIPEARKGLIDQYTGQGSIQRPRQNTLSGTQQVGNMDVTFDKSTPLAARKAFMQNPVAPTGQMAQYEKYMNTPRGQNFGVQKIADNTPTPLNTFGDVMREKARRSLLRDQSAIATAEGGLVNDADRNRISEEGNAMTYGLGLDRNNIDVRGQDIDARGQDLLARSAAERNRIDATTAEANSQSAQIDAEGKNLEIQDKLRKSGYEQKYYDPKTPEDERRRIEGLLGIKNKPEFFTDQGVTPDGMPTKETYIYENGNVRRAAPQEAPEMGIINGNPQYSAAFNAATPERRQEMLAELRKRLSQSAK